MASCYDNVPAPMDANGCVVPLDTKELVHKGETREVYGFFYNIRLKDWSVKFMKGDGIRLGACTMPDSWESLEEDAGKSTCGYFGHSGGSCACCPATSFNDACILAKAKDIVRRAKALAGASDDD